MRNFLGQTLCLYLHLCELMLKSLVEVECFICQCNIYQINKHRSNSAFKNIFTYIKGWILIL